MVDNIIVRTTHSQQEICEAISLRYEVFILEEKRARTVESDDVDSNCQHVVAMKDGIVVGTLRLYLLSPNDKDIKIGRVAVQKDLRGTGTGRLLMAVAHEWAATRYHSIYLYAQVGVRGFYEKLGYIAEGEVFQESGTPHILMRYMPSQ